MKPKNFRLLLVIAITFLAGYYFGTSKVAFDWKNFSPNLSVTSKEPPSSVSNVDFALFWNVWQKLEATYYDKKVFDRQKMLYGAISGMVQSVGDPYTVFLPPTDNKDFKQGLAGEFDGIGAELGMKGKQIIVVAPLDGGPAEKAGIKAGDAIIKVNDQATYGWTLAQAVEKIRGPRGTEVSLGIVKKGADEPTILKLTRDKITVKSVTAWLKKVKDIDNIKTDGLNGDNEIAYIRLSQFGDNTNEEWLSAVNKLNLEIKNGKNVKGVIFDLRNNPGGYLTDATFVASEFLKSGTVVIQDKGNGEKTPFNVSRQGLLTDIPLIVLINKGSASASEIVAGALHDYNRAKLLGETSFGKGTIQQAEDLGNGAGLHVTIAKWLTPKETWVHGKGLTPDISVNLDTKDQNHDTQLEKAVQELVR